MDIIRPEVLAPAGDAERLKAAVYYGADAGLYGWNALRHACRAEEFFGR